jgi:hypothetical protein
MFSKFFLLRRLWDKWVIFAITQGLALPGLDRARSRLSDEDRASLERRVLVREIKGSRLLVQSGPLWLRRLVARPATFFVRYRGLAVLFFKMLLGAFVIVLPVGFFVLVRGVLPVPGRVPFAEPAFHLPQQSQLRTDWPYTNGRQVGAVQPLNLVQPGVFRGADVSWLDAEAFPFGLVKVGLGQLPGRLQEFRGFLVGEGAPVSLVRSGKYPPEISGKNRLLFWLWLFPSEDRDTQCRIEVRDDAGRTLLAVESGVPSLKGAATTGFWENFRERLMPASVSVAEKVQEFSIELDSLPSQLSLRSVRVGDSVPVEEAVHEKFIAGAEVTRRAPRWASFPVRDLSDSRCVYAVGRIAYERSVVHSLPKRGLVMISVDGLRESLVRDTNLMPKLGKLMSEKSVVFDSHFSSGNVPSLAMPSIWNSVSAREISRRSSESEDSWDVGVSSTPLVRAVQQAGYRSVTIGHLSGDDTGSWEEAIAIENRHYETRSITEEAGRWLERNGDSPFFMHLHYATFRSPFRPPFEDLSVWDFLRSPFGYGAESALEEGLARFFDKEIARIVAKLEGFGILNDVDIVFVGVHGAQMSLLDYGKALHTAWKEPAAARSRTFLTDDELRVPFFWVRSGSRHSSIQVKDPTTHLDIAPTVAGILGAGIPDFWKGRDLSRVAGDLGRGSLPAVPWFVADGLRSTGIFSPKTGRKYVRQFTKDNAVLFRIGFPWREFVDWDAGDYFSKRGSSGNELWTKELPVSEARVLRAALWEHAAASRKLSFEFLQSGPWDFRIEAENEVADDVMVDALPAGVDVRRERGGSSSVLVVQGLVKAGERFELRWRKTRWKSVVWSSPFDVVGCAEGKTISPQTLLSELRSPSCLSGEDAPVGAGELSRRTHVRLDVVENENARETQTSFQEKGSSNF